MIFVKKQRNQGSRLVHADNFNRFAMINNNEIDYISTDFLAPDLKDNSLLLMIIKVLKNLTIQGN